MHCYIQKIPRTEILKMTAIYNYNPDNNNISILVQLKIPNSIFEKKFFMQIKNFSFSLFFFNKSLMMVKLYHTNTVTVAPFLESNAEFTPSN